MNVELLEKRKQFTDTIYTHKSCVMPGVHELIAKTKGNNMKLSVSSGAPLRQIELVMDKFNWHDHFDALISSDHVNFIGKPDPAIYLHTAKVLKVEPAHCVVFEDAVRKNIFRYTAGHPYEVQLLASHLYDSQIEGKSGMDSWDNALNNTLKELGRDYFNFLFSKASDREKDLLKILAEEKRPVTIKDFTTMMIVGKRAKKFPIANIKNFLYRLVFQRRYIFYLHFLVKVDCITNRKLDLILIALI